MENENSHAFVPNSKEAFTNNVYLNVYSFTKPLYYANIDL